MIDESILLLLSFRPVFASHDVEPGTFAEDFGYGFPEAARCGFQFRDFARRKPQRKKLASPVALRFGWSSGHVTVADYTAWKNGGEKCRDELAIFIKERLRERYIDPLASNAKKNGFAIMALSCFLMETLESFYQGWPSPNSALAFCSFFDRQQRFDDFRSYSGEFYKNVRCGILHQGETVGRCAVTRDKASPIFDRSKLRINATKFHKRLALCLDDYSRQLRACDTADNLWKNFFKKMDATVKTIG